MVYKKLKKVMLGCVFLINALHAEGFLAGTLVNMQQARIPIDLILIGDVTINKCLVTSTEHYLTDCFIKIKVEDCIMCAAFDQKFYLDNKRKWVNARDLNPCDLLLCFNGKAVEVHELTVIYEPCIMHTISIEQSHIFTITTHEILAHNIEPVGGAAAVVLLSVACPPAGAALAFLKVITFGIVGAGMYYVHKKQKKQKEIAKNFVENKSVSGSGSGKDPNHDDDKEKHPHGIYEDASYHHINSAKGKSPSPREGQKCLDRSVSGKGLQRIAIEGKKFVVLKQTAPRTFHGYVVTWGELHVELQNILKDHGLVTGKGKIIKHMINKVL